MESITPIEALKRDIANQQKQIQTANMRVVQLASIVNEGRRLVPLYDSKNAKGLSYQEQLVRERAFADQLDEFIKTLR